jgi:hypothetical protein
LLIIIIMREKKEKISAGSGMLVLPFVSNISNPRVLSDMGLAIPRPTRLLPALAGLGDPRLVFESLFEIIILLLILIACLKGLVVVISSTPSRNSDAASRFSFNFLFSLYLIRRCLSFVNWSLFSTYALSVFERR